MATVTAQNPTTRQISGRLPSGEFGLFVLAKRTYRIDSGGRCIPAQEEIPLQEDLRVEDDTQEVIAADTDLFPWKPLTDVVILGHAHTQRLLPEFPVGIRIGQHTKMITAVGPRRAKIDAYGQPRFSDPEPIAKVPLSYRFAYGGRDKTAEAKHGNPAELLAKVLPMKRPSDVSPFLYPRNPEGRGYLVELSRSAVEALELPQLEDPQDRLSPARLAAGSPARWSEMPVSQSLGWLSYAWFPRSSHFGVVPPRDASSPVPLEIRKGWTPPEVLREAPVTEKITARAANGASPGLQLPYLRGDEEGILHNLSATTPRLPFRLPRELPRMWTDGRKGPLVATSAPVLHSIVIEPDEMRLSLLWRGCAPALRPYFARELANMPFRVEW